MRVISVKTLKSFWEEHTDGGEFFAGMVYRGKES
jgi:hypothetical protein